MSFLLVGFILGCLISVAGVYSMRQSSDIYKEQVTKLERKLIIAEYQHAELQTAHKELKTTFNESFEEITKPDGTKVVRRITNNTSDSVANSSSQSTTNQTIRSEQTAAQTAVTSRERKGISLDLGLDTGLDLHFTAGYQIAPPFVLGIGIEVNPNNINVIKGLQLNIGIRL